MLEHVKAAEAALRQRARRAGRTDKARLEHQAELLSQIQRDFRDRPLSEGAIARRELVDALLGGTDALRLQADAERQAASKGRNRAEHEAKADELEQHADAILELDRDLI